MQAVGFKVRWGGSLGRSSFQHSLYAQGMAQGVALRWIRRHTVGEGLDTELRGSDHLFALCFLGI